MSLAKFRQQLAAESDRQHENTGQMVIELAPKAPVSEALRQLCRALTGRTMQGATAKNAASIFSFLKGKKQA